MMYWFLRNTREAQKVSLGEMAEVLGLKTKSAYFKKECGDRSFSVLEAKKVADRFNMSIEQLFFEN